MKKYYLALILTLFSVTGYASLRFFTGDGLDLGSVTDASCASGVGCSVVSGKVEISTGQQKQTLVHTSTTATASKCGGSYISDATVTVTLPEASTVLGCRFTFIVGNTLTLTVDPADATDRIAILTNAAGDAISSGVVGNSITLQAISDDTWVVVGKEQGTWADAN